MGRLITRTRTARIRSLAAALAATGLAGCTVDRNDSLELGNAVQLDTLADGGVRWTAPIQPGVADPPSVRSLDRADWAPHTFLVPVSGTYHYPTYASDVPYLPAAARDGGVHPDRDSAMTTVELAAEWDAARAAAEPFWAVADLFLFPVRAATEPPWRVVHSPDRGRDRAPMGGGPGGLASLRDATATTAAPSTQPAAPAPAEGRGSPAYDPAGPAVAPLPPRAPGDDAAPARPTPDAPLPPLPEAKPSGGRR